MPNPTKSMRVFRRCFSVFTILLIVGFQLVSCKKDEPKPEVAPSDNLSLDSVVATKTNIVVWEENHITAFARGPAITFKWQTNHGSMVGIDSSTVLYWACPTCVGDNTVKCTVSNAFGSISDTLVIHVTP